MLCDQIVPQSMLYGQEILYKRPMNRMYRGQFSMLRLYTHCFVDMTEPYTMTQEYNVPFNG